MQQEQYNTPQAFKDQSTQSKEGTLLKDGANLGFYVGELSQREKEDLARSDVYAATQPLVAEVQERVNHTSERQLTQQEMIGLNGRRVVYGLRKPQSENSINLFDDNVSNAPYLQSQISTTEDASQEAA